LINKVKTSRIQGPKCIKGIKNINLDDRPSHLVKSAEAVKAWGLVRREGSYNRPHFILGEAVIPAQAAVWET
jgi:hypothetical protein